MAQATKTASDSSGSGHRIARGLREGALLLLAASTLFLLLSLVTYDARDHGWSSTGSNAAIHNIGGPAGALFADLAYTLFGYLGYLFPLYLVGVMVWVYGHGEGGFRVGAPIGIYRLTGLLLTLGCGTALAALHFDPQVLPQGPGGWLGHELGQRIQDNFSFVGATLFLLALFLTGVTWLTGLSWLWLSEVTGAKVLKAIAWAGHRLRHQADVTEGKRVRGERKEKAVRHSSKLSYRKPVRIEPVVRALETSRRLEEEKQGELFEGGAQIGPPPLALLDEGIPSDTELSQAALAAISRRVELKLEEFGIEVQVVAVHPGPVITRFELEPAAGVKVSQITNLAKDLARALSVVSVRVVEVIAGKSTVGLEIPNEIREVVRLRDTLSSRAYDESSSLLTLALGKDIQGNPVVVDVAKMPHLLVSGTTGSGKSVAINAMILSLLFKATPTDVRLIMIDPKMLELSVYEGIPHLLAPVVTDMREAANALNWCVAEMERRYKRMAALGVRNVGGYNRKVREAMQRETPLVDPLHRPVASFDDDADPPEPVYCEPLPFIVVIIDELADMMMVVGKKVEQLIARLAQKARASGIHLIVATQRPSVDVITGLIKANIPVRIAFQVSSKVDSRTILDQMGAEQLLGHGDMLYLPPGTSIPQRIHGAFVSDEEVHRVVAELKKQSAPDYLEEILSGGGDEAEPGNGAEDGGNEADDELYDKAVYLVSKSRRASVSGVQRHLRVGYNRAARLVEEMERQGIVGPVQSNGQRDVLAQAPPE